MTPNLDRFYQLNSDGKPIPDKAALLLANDEDFFAVMADTKCRLRPHKVGDARLLHSAPHGMKAYVYVARDGSTLAAYFVDSRIRFTPGVSESEVLITTSDKWSPLTKHHAGATAGLLPSIFVPFFP